MSLSSELLAQAKHLAAKEPRRPRDASLRRAVSAAYYALFHLLTAEASTFLVSGSGRGGLRSLLARGFAHSEMSRASKAFSSGHGGLPGHLQAVIPDRDFPLGLSAIARTFYQVQAERHRADYDLSYRLTRKETAAIVSRVEWVFAEWRTVRGTEGARVYLVALLLWERWKAR